MFLIFCLAQASTYVLLCLLPLVIFFRRAWDKYYLLTGKTVMKEIYIDGNDLIFIGYQNGKRDQVEIADQLHLNKYLLLFFVEEKSSDSMKEYKENKGFILIKKNLKKFLFNLNREISLFFSLHKIVFVVSEDSLGEYAYRELLRRLHYRKDSQI